MPDGSVGASRPAADKNPTPPDGGSLIDSATELIETAVTYARQEAGDLVHDKVVVPIQGAGATAGLALAAAMVGATGLAFVAVGLLILLAKLITWPGALLLIGVVMLVVAFLLIRSRMKKVQP